jgi:hypothetical protein
MGARAASGVNVATVAAAFSVTLPDTEVLPATTWNVVEPLATARSNPTATDDPSATPVAPGAGVCEVTDGGIAVANDHDTGSIDAPASFTAPDTVTRYDTAGLNAAVGVKVAVFVLASYADEPATTADDGSVTTMVWPVTGWLNPTATAVLTSTAVAPEAGDCDVIVGRAAVVKLHVTGAMKAPPDDALPDTVTEYVVAGKSAEVGVNVAATPSPLRLTLPATALPAPSTSWKVVVPVATARSKPATSVVASATPVAPGAGVFEITAGGAVVVNDHVVASTCAPAALVAPETVTPNVDSWFSSADGVNVAVFVAALYAVEPAMTLEAESVRTTVAPVTDSLNPTTTVVPRATSAAFGPGVRVAIVGRAAVVNVRVAGVITAPPSEVAPDTVTEYVVFGARAASGANVAVVAGASRVSVPETGLPPSSTTAIDGEPGATGRLKLTPIDVPSATPVAFGAGVREVTDGGAVVVNDQESGAGIAFWSGVLAPETTTE